MRLAEFAGVWIGRLLGWLARKPAGWLAGFDKLSLCDVGVSGCRGRTRPGAKGSSL
ncbi:hypothetical protein NOVOSPHI9U_40749 [Novosphingobium sp. 9U]|nr:hypothetical protein NOVOSPHI9U_40749 [Novosphingobium sp. 9U]